ncbi:MAG: type II secretion system protein GspN [Proteobacteria bacterium]|nr:type II secretion system protein GspN [Pseudomonadota bacterium]
MKKAVIAIIAILLVFIGLWLVVVPEALIISHMEAALGRQGIKLRIMGFSKGLLYNFSVGQIHVSTEKDFPIVIVSDLHAGIDFLSLLKFKPQLDFSGGVSGGRVYGVIDLRGQGTGGGRTINVNGDGININGIPALERFGVRGNGNLGFDLHLMDDTGEARFSIREARFEGAFSGVDFLPLDLFQSVRGALTIKKTITVKSLTLEGRGVYSRINGNINGNSVDMNIELMVDSSFELEPVLAEVLGSYRVSPGYYVIPFSHAALPSSGQP